MRSLTKKVLLIGCSAVIAANFWMFARFTVDDAFITWRYGKNLIKHGIWNYNPSTFDMTQGYTNPIFAFLSIIPVALNIDMVFFFKMVSMIVLVSFGIWYAKKTNKGIFAILVAYMLPHTMIHAFSGLETFLFIALSTALIISICEESTKKIIILAILLLYTRPESLVLFLAIPLLYCNWKLFEYKDLLKIDKFTAGKFFYFFKNFITKKSIIMFSMLLAAFLPNLIMSYLNFGTILPNTFFVKDGLFSLKKLVKYGFMILPLFFIFRYISIKKLASILVYFIPIVIQYSKTNFVMDYALRSTYHILLPVAFLIFYLINNSRADNYFVNIYFDNNIQNRISIKYKSICITMLTLSLLFSFVISGRGIVSESVSLVNYYYRAMFAHAEAGKIINSIKDKYVIKSIACGDAGMLAFNADIDSLDLFELGSASLTHKGLEETFPLYNPTILFLHGNEDVRPGIFQDIVRMTQLQFIGKVTWKKNYYLYVYSDRNIPELDKVFQTSYSVNIKREREILMEHIFYPPWLQWHQ
jgi:hypothetical protein